MVHGLGGASEASVEAREGVWPAGESVKGEFHCADCGYGITVYRTLPLCPMCGCEQWQQSAWSPFGRSRLTTDL